MRQGELDVLVREHNVVVSAQILVLHDGGLDDLDRTIASAVGSSHLLIALLHSSQKRGVTVLLVHVVRTRARVVTQPDTVVLDLVVRLVDLKRYRFTKSLPPPQKGSRQFPSSSSPVCA